MPFKKKPKKCYCCKRILKDTAYNIVAANCVHSVCAGCEYIFKLMKREEERKKGILRTITNLVYNYKRHCTICRSYDTGNTAYCREGKWTGIGDRHEESYPNSYANHGCPRYQRDG